MNKIPCIYGHDISKYNRKDRRCGKCHSERNARYEKTSKGVSAISKYEQRRRQKPERWYYNIKSKIKSRIARKKAKIAEMERMLV